MTTPLAHIVDDDEAIRDALTWLLRTRNVAARTWSSAEEFLAGWQPDFNGCIVLDIRMREMSGLECFDALLERHNPMPVIFLTGHGDVPMAVSTLKKGRIRLPRKAL
jgi:two-component system response regulator DctR